MISLRVLSLSLLVGSSVSSSCVWPDWSAEECSLPVCPDCSLVTCGQDLLQSQCPEGSILESGQLYGCCPACVKYLEYSDLCPGVSWSRDGDSVTADNIVFGDDLSPGLSEWPDKYIE